MEESAGVILGRGFRYRQKLLFAEDCSAADLAARFGTPLFVYSRANLLAQIEAIQAAFAPVAPKICYSVKANPNLAILREMRGRGLGADVVSGGELRRALRAGFRPGDIVFAGVGKTDEEIEYAVRAGIFAFTVENPDELVRIDRYARRAGREAVCCLRLNLDVAVNTHHYVSTAHRRAKFGVALEVAAGLVKKWSVRGSARVRGLHFHLGSGIEEPSFYLKALARVKRFCRSTGFHPEILDIGGGFGIPYRGADACAGIDVFGRAVCGFLEGFRVHTLVLEPGRFLVGNAGMLLTRVLYVKTTGETTFVITDAGMNDLVRPAFYGSYHEILPVAARRGRPFTVDIVGPICQSGDFFARARRLPCKVNPGDILAIASAGAYCASMASTYNSRRRPCEVLVDGAQATVIRKRDSYEDLWRNERLAGR